MDYIELARKFGVGRFKDSLARYRTEKSDYGRGILWGCALGNWEMLRAGNFLSPKKLAAMETELRSM